MVTHGDSFDFLFLQYLLTIFVDTGFIFCYWYILVICSVTLEVVGSYSKVILIHLITKSELFIIENIKF